MLGAIAGFAVGMYVAQRVGGFSGLTERFRRLRKHDGDVAGVEDLPVAEFDEIEDEVEDETEIGATRSDDEDFNGMDAVDEDIPLLEERVLEAFNNDPILAERAIDIGAMGTGSGVIELAGWVDSDDEAEHAMTIARGVPGVETVVNRLLVDDEEQQIGDNVRRFNEGDPALKEAGWEGQQVGTGKRRQGTSDEADRHADPKPVLEDHWLSKREAVRNSADNIDEISAERRAKRGKGAKSTRADSAEPPSGA